VLLDAITTTIDTGLFDPTITASADQPASLTNGLVAINSTGATTAAIQTDLAAMADAISADMIAPAWIMRPAAAVKLALLGLTSKRSARRSNRERRNT
jgi:hypothetical protein